MSKYKDYRRKISSFTIKNELRFILLKDLIIRAVFWVISLSLVIFLFISTEVCSNEKIFSTDLKFDFVLAQLNITLVISSIIALMTGLSSKRILGKKQINVLFMKKSIFSINKTLIYLYILFFLNLTFCLGKFNEIYLLFDFIITIMLIFYLLYELALFYSYNEHFKKVVLARYIKEMEENYKRGNPSLYNKDGDLIEFKNWTMALIEHGDKEYIFNIKTMEYMEKYIYEKNNNEVQEFYTEFVMENDHISTTLFEFAQNLIEQHKEKEAAKLILRQMKNFEYYDVIPVSLHIKDYVIGLLIERGKYINNSIDAKAYFSDLIRISMINMHLIYDYTQKELSFTRLGKLDLIDFYESSGFLSRIYDSLYNNKHLTDEEKDEIVELIFLEIRLIGHYESFPTAKYKNQVEKTYREPINIPVEIKGEPIVLFMISIIKRKPNAIIIALKEINQDSVEAYVNILLRMILISHIIYEREYIMDIDITDENTKEVLRKMGYEYKCNNAELLKEIYYAIKNNNSHENLNNRLYWFNPKVVLKMEFIEVYFRLIYNIFDDESRIECKKEDEVGLIEKKLMDCLETLKV